MGGGGTRYGLCKCCGVLTCESRFKGKVLHMPVGFKILRQIPRDGGLWQNNDSGAVLSGFLDEGGEFITIGSNGPEVGGALYSGHFDVEWTSGWVSSSRRCGMQVETDQANQKAKAGCRVSHEWH